MKKILTTCFAIAVLTQVDAQQALKEGKILFERTAQLQIQLSGNDEMANMIPRERKDRYELRFGNNQSIWQRQEEDPDNGDMVFNNGGAQIRMVMPGGNDVLYNNFALGKKVEKRELGMKEFLVEDSIRVMPWKFAEETKVILGYTCRKATTQRIQPSFRMTMDNGQAKREQVMDTMNIVAWFTDGIPVFAGPDTYQGQLPGMILEVNVNNGRAVFKALEITAKVDLSAIKEPKGGKKITQEEFNKEREKLMKEMQQNGGPGQRSFRIGG